MIFDWLQRTAKLSAIGVGHQILIRVESRAATHDNDLAFCNTKKIRLVQRQWR